MKLKDYVFILENYSCNKKCPYCIAKMNKNNTDNIDSEINKLIDKLNNYKNNNITFDYFVLSGNGEPSLYDYGILKKIKDIVESYNLFDEYRIQTSGNLFLEIDKLKLFDNWIKEITVISSNPIEDQSFYNYKKSYLDKKSFINSNNIRVNIVLLKSNIDKINKYIDDFSSMNNVSSVALKLLDNSNNSTNESKWISENALNYNDIDNILNTIQIENNLITFSKKRFIFKTKNNKLLTMHYSFKNTYDDININKEFHWHNRPIKKGIYGEFSKVEEEVDEAREALEQNNHLMYLIELSDIIGSIEKIAENHNLSLNDLISFSNKVKESK